MSTGFPPGVTSGATDRPLEALRALAARYPGTVVSHRTAARLYRMRRPGSWSRDPVLDLTRGDNSRALRRPGVRCHRSLLTGDDVVEVEGVPVTSPVRTSVDLCSELSVLDAVIMADGLVCAHRHGLRAGMPPVCTLE